MIYKGMLYKSIVNLILFILANASYHNVFGTVGYMYTFWPNQGLLQFVVLSVITFSLSFVAYSRDVVYRIGLDLLVLGVFLPVAVMVTQMNISLIYVLYPVTIILIVSAFINLVFKKSDLVLDSQILLSSNLSHAFRKIKEMSDFFVIALFCVFMAYIVLDNYQFLNAGLFETYLRTYEIRSERQASGVIGYLIGWFVLVFLPFMFTQSLGRSRWFFIVLVLIGSVFIFQIYARKIIILNALLLLFYYCIYQRPLLRSYFAQIFFGAIISLPLFFDILFNPMVDRFFYLVGANAIYYFDFFSTNELMFFEGTKLSLGISNYGVPPGYLIDNAYYQGYGVNQSAGFLPSMYADLGFPGVVIGAFLVAFIFRLIKFLGILGVELSSFIMLSFAFTLMNHSLNMLFLSNGLVYIFVLAFALKLVIVRVEGRVLSKPRSVGFL
jgi:hypothetical protein